MPNYNVINKKTKVVKTIWFDSIADMEAWEKKYPGMEVLPGAPLIATHGVMGLKSFTTDTDFRSRLKDIAKRSPGNTMNKTTKF